MPRPHGLLRRAEPGDQEGHRPLLSNTLTKRASRWAICGQAPSVYPEFCEFLVREGIDSISLNADTVLKTMNHVAAAEQRIILEAIRKR